MNIKMLEGTFQSQGGDRVAVAGDFNGWSTLPDTLRDPDGDSVYAATRLLPTGPITYKFWKTLRGGIDWEGDPNRTYTVMSGNQTLPPAYFDRDSVNNAPVYVPVTFRVNMRVKILEGTFQTNSGDIVRVLGTFNNWGTTPDTLVHEPAPFDSIYRRTTALPESTTIQFKYWKTIRGGIGFESGSNRVYTVPRGGGIVPLVYFDNDSIINVPITANIVWRVNMRSFQNIGWFDQTVDSVQVRLQIMGWNGIRMLLDPLSQLYRVVIPYSGVGFDDLAYKYYIKFDSATAVARFPGWQDVLLRDAMQFEHPYALGDGERIFNVQNGGNISTPPYYFSDVHPYWTMNSTLDTVRVTLRVNMGPATRYIDPFNPTIDTLKVVWRDALWHAAQIANQGTFPREIRMTRQSPTDSVWWATFRVKGKAHFGMMYV
ncbi:MAG: hypothetical protein AAB393_08005, partial [Bacteroidota bacterium]